MFDKVLQCAPCAQSALVWHDSRHTPFVLSQLYGLHGTRNQSLHWPLSVFLYTLETFSAQAEGHSSPGLFDCCGDAPPPSPFAGG
jgi:hypothetical protein